MAVNNIPVFLALPKSGHVQILPADTSSLKTAYTGGTNGSKIIGIFGSSTGSVGGWFPRGPRISRSVTG